MDMRKTAGEILEAAEKLENFGKAVENIRQQIEDTHRSLSYQLEEDLSHVAEDCFSQGVVAGILYAKGQLKGYDTGDVHATAAVDTDAVYTIAHEAPELQVIGERVQQRHVKYYKDEMQEWYATNFKDFI